MKKNTELVELTIGDQLQIGDVVVENKIGYDVRYTVFKVNPQSVSAYSEYMRRRIFPLEYCENFKGHMCNSVAKVYRYKKC